MSKLETNTIDTVSGTNTLQVGDGNVATINLGKSGDTINVPSGVTIANSGTATGFAANTPAFHAYLSSTVEVGNNVSTKLAANTEIFDTDSNYNNSTYRFQPQTAGKYFIYGMINGTTNAYKIYFIKASVFKNGSEYATNNNTINTNVLQRLGVGIQTVVDMNGSSDYVEMFGTVDIHTNGTEQFVGSSTQPSYFGAYKILT